MELSSIGGFLGFLGACFAAAASGAIFTPGPWYDALKKPRWCPPNWLFAPAWGVLFLMIAIAGWLIWEAVGFSDGALALSLYALQLVLNAAWSGIFFGMRRMDLAFGELCLLWLSILACIIVFWPIDVRAALLMVPYLAWVSFAGALNFTMWRLNPGLAR
ncbi:MAG: tryptophan-rich sensory protein [Roseomonas sp.]|nr:tryptophan-rich sensory protein [Roseomonas sp.]